MFDMPLCSFYVDIKIDIKSDTTKKEKQLWSKYTVYLEDKHLDFIFLSRSIF